MKFLYVLLLLLSFSIQAEEVLRTSDEEAQIAVSIWKDIRAQAPQDIKDLLKQEEDLNQTCRGESGDKSSTWVACDARDKLSLKLNALGWCYGDGTPIQPEYQKTWQYCNVIVKKVE
jgi:hypothetical protein